MSDSQYDVIVIGAGITGLTAAKQVAQRGLSVANIEMMMFGGLVININELDPSPSGEHGSGTELASTLMMKISDMGVANLSETVSALARDGNRIAVTTDAGTHHARAVIIASGARLKRLGIPGELEFEGRGVSQCADCDGPMYKDEEVVVVGGGDSALQEALSLTAYCKQVHLAHRGTKFRARQHLVDKVTTNGKIVPLWNTVAEAVLGDQGVNKVRVRNTADGTTREIACAGLFAFIGLEPACEYAGADIQRDGNGFLVTDAAMQTAMAGVFAAGAVRAGYGGLLSDAIADAQAAAKGAVAACGK
jgi:thioredoxin reductase (NADPH)